MYIHRGQHRFRTPLDYRYQLYPLPSVADVRCPKCRARCHFGVTARESFAKDEQSGGYRLLSLPIEGCLSGEGICANCSNSFTTVRWPEDAYFSVNVHGGIVWAWNKSYLAALRARIAGDKLQQRQLALSDGSLPYFLARIPKHAIVKRNRERLLRVLEDWLKAENPRPSRR